MCLQEEFLTVDFHQSPSHDTRRVDGLTLDRCNPSHGVGTPSYIGELASHVSEK